MTCDNTPSATVSVSTLPVLVVVIDLMLGMTVDPNFADCPLPGISCHVYTS